MMTTIEEGGSWSSKIKRLLQVVWRVFFPNLENDYCILKLIYTVITTFLLITKPLQPDEKNWIFIETEEGENGA